VAASWLRPASPGMTTRRFATIVSMLSGSRLRNARLQSVASLGSGGPETELGGAHVFEIEQMKNESLRTKYPAPIRKFDHHLQVAG
jgi:hypothetical protein